MKIKFQNLIEDSLAYKRLEDDIIAENVSHAYVFVSADFVALEVLAKLFLARLIGGDLSGAMATRVLDGSLLDLLYLPLQPPDHRECKLKVSDTDFIADTCYLTPTELEHKYYILKADEPIAENVQNKLLKTLEEPPDCARFIIFSKGGDLLPTVLSRCRVVRLEEFASSKILDELTRFYSDELNVSLAAASCGGLIGVAQQMVESTRYRQMYETAYDILLNMKRSPEILPYAGTLAALKEYLPLTLDYFELILRDVMVYNSAKPDLLAMKNNSYDIITLSKQYTIEEILGIMPILARAKARLKSYCNFASIVDELLFSILEVKAKCKR